MFKDELLYQERKERKDDFGRIVFTAVRSVYKPGLITKVKLIWEFKSFKEASKKLVWTLDGEVNTYWDKQ